MNVEIWTEAVQFPEKEYINGIFVAVRLVVAENRLLKVNTSYGTAQQIFIY
jgi:hypothetical protein